LFDNIIFVKLACSPDRISNY